MKTIKDRYLDKYSRSQEHLRRNSYINTFKGHQFNYVNPEITDIDIEDIAHGLSNICRYSGQCKRFYSVAEHCIRGYEKLRKSTNSSLVLLIWLLHDASEAYMVDIPKPLKNLLPEYEKIEEKIQKLIYKKFVDINYIEYSQQDIKRIDNLMLEIEKEQLFDHNWYFDIEFFWKPRWLIKRKFLKIFNKLINDLGPVEYIDPIQNYLPAKYDA